MAKMHSVTMFICTISVLFAQYSRTEAVLYGYEDPSLNLVDNWDFEDDISENDWNLCDCSAERVEGGYTGNYSLRVFGRTSNVSSPCQKINAVEKDLKRNTNYYFSVFVKVNDFDDAFPNATVDGFSLITLPSGETIPHLCGTLPYIVETGIWHQMGGPFKTPDEDFSDVEILLQVNPVASDFQVDTWSLIELVPDPDWKTNLYQQARAIRMENQTVIGTIGSSIDVIPGQTSVKIELTRHELMFGTAIRADDFNGVDEVNINYRNFATSHFNLIVFHNDMKWKTMEQERGTIRFERVDNAMAYLEPFNMSFRGHCILWDKAPNHPPWVANLTGEELIPEINRRIEYMVEHYHGQIDEWDINNEFLHGHFYEETTGNWSLLGGQFHLAHSLDPGARMCLNDYEVVRDIGAVASAQANLARALLAMGVPVHCVGVQSHLRTLPVDTEVLQKHLDIVAAAGLPISVTELSHHNYNVSIRAEGVETAFRVYWAHPSVETINYWGFGDQFHPFADDHYLTEGIDFTPNEAGERFLDLLYGDYHTSEEVVLTENTFTYEFPAFRGNYRLTVENSGVVKYETDFYVGKEGDHVFIFATP